MSLFTLQTVKKFGKAVGVEKNKLNSKISES